MTFSIPKENPVVLLNRLDYDYHFIIDKVSKEAAEESNCPVENSLKQSTFPVPITKEVKKIDKNEKKKKKKKLYLTD